MKNPVHIAGTGISGWLPRKRGRPFLRLYKAQLHNTSTIYLITNFVLTSKICKMKSKIFASLVMLFIGVSLMAQTKITGTVRDNVGPLVGVSVLEQGTTTNGTVTDADGKFALTVKPNATIVFSSIGYKDQVVAIGNQTTFNIKLEEDAELLEETVVVGYGVQKKSDVTGSVASVDSDQMMKRTPTTIAEGLQGVAAGVVITQASGDPTGGMSIRIRGVATMQGDTNPLWVVDGVQYGTNSNLSWLDPQDVDHLEILKDASATAIYGARGANGVILVTTKKGKVGKTRVDFKADFGISTYSDRLKVCSLDEWLDAYRMSCEIDGKVPFEAFNGQYDNRLNEIDWQDVMTQTSFRQQYSLSISGGSDAVRTNFSIGYLDNKGIIVNSWNKRLNLRLNTDFTLAKWLKAGISVNFNTSKGNGGGNMMGYARTLPTMDYVDPATGQLVNMPVVLEDGTFGHFIYDQIVTFSAGKGGSNPYQGAMYRTFGKDWDNDNGSIRNALWAEVTLAKGLTFRTNLNYDFSGNNSWSYDPAHITSMYSYMDLNGKDPMDSFSTSGSASTSLGAENYITYDANWKKSHFTAMIGMSASNYHSSSNGSSTKDLTFPFLRGFYSTDPKGYNDGSGGPNIASRFISYFARLNYSYDGRYMLTATVRRDGSSNFGRDNRWGTFPSFAFAWNLGNEKFIKNLGVFDTLKLRAGWGETGNANVNPTASVPQLSVSGVTFDFFDQNAAYVRYVGIAQNSEIDTGLKWETSAQTNVGLDMAFFKNSLSFSVDWYRRDTRDLILAKAIRPSAGFDSITTNFGSIRNTGWEFAVGYKKQFNRDWYFAVSATGSTNKNEAIDIGSGTTESGEDGSAWENRQVCYNGLALGTYQGYAVDHIIRDQAEIDKLNARAAELYGPGTYWDKASTGPGDWLYKDLNNDGRITTDDKYFMGNGFVALNYGLNINVNFRNWDASMYMYGALGQKILSWSKCYLTAINNASEGYFNFLSEVAQDSWTPSNPDAKYPRLSRDDLSYNKRVSDYYVENGDYLKISSLQIGYKFDIPAVNKIFRNLRVYASVRNLATFSPYKKYGDPEIYSGVTTTGYDGGRYPFPRTFMFGLQVGL